MNSIGILTSLYPDDAGFVVNERGGGERLSVNFVCVFAAVVAEGRGLIIGIRDKNQ